MLSLTVRFSVLDNFSFPDFQKVIRFGKSDSVAKVQKITNTQCMFG